MLFAQHTPNFAKTFVLCSDHSKYHCLVEGCSKLCQVTVSAVPGSFLMLIHRYLVLRASCKFEKISIFRLSCNGSRQFFLFIFKIQSTGVIRIQRPPPRPEKIDKRNLQKPVIRNFDQFLHIFIRKNKFANFLCYCVTNGFVRRTRNSI